MSDDAFFTHKADPAGRTIVTFQAESLMSQADIEAAAAALCQLVQGPGPHRLALDLGRVRYLSSQAIGMLVRLNKQVAAGRGSKLALCGVNPPLMDLLRITRLDKVFTVRPSLAEAVKAV